MARPIVWDDKKKKESCNIILSRIEEGESCRGILKTGRDENLPSNRLFIEWLAEDTELSKRYAYACEMRAEVMADETIEISDNIGSDRVILKDGREVVDNAVIQRDRLRVDTRKWLLAKLHPKKYGDKIDVAHSGSVTLHFDHDDQNL